MVVIRFARTGKKKQAFYRVVVADSKRPVTAKFIKIIGWYNPHNKELNIKKEELAEWLSKGAKPSNSLAVILKKENIKMPNWVVIKEKVSKPKSEAKPADKAALPQNQDEPETEEKDETQKEEKVNTSEDQVEKVIVKDEEEQKTNSSDDGEPSTEDK